MKSACKIISIFAICLSFFVVFNAHASWFYFLTATGSQQEANINLDSFYFGDALYPSVDEMLEDDNSSENVFDGSADIVIDETSGEINIESTQDTSSVFFTLDFIYSLQEMGYTRIILETYSTNNSWISNVTYYNYNYNATNQTQNWFKLFLTSSLTIDISTPLIKNDDGTYSFEYEGQTYQAINPYLNASTECSWEILNMRFQ